MILMQIKLARIATKNLTIYYVIVEQHATCRQSIPIMKFDHESSLMNLK